MKDYLNIVWLGPHIGQQNCIARQMWVCIPEWGL